MPTRTRPDLIDHARAERADLLAFCSTLTPEQWMTSSLCDDWTVRDVVAHLISYDVLTVPGLIRRFLQGGLQPTRINAIGVRRGAEITTDDVLDQLRTHLTPTGLTAGFKGGIALTDGIIHHQDIRRPLGLPRTVPADRLAPALDFALTAPTLPTRRLVRGLELIATDLDWRCGTGLEVHGTGEALLLAIAGRPGVTRELTGPGGAEWRRRAAQAA